MRSDVAAVIAGLKWLFHRVQAVGKLITRLINLVLIAVVYFAVIGPMSLVFRLAGRDPLERRDVPARPSHWSLKDPTPAELERFRRQF
jgi:large-conductance mechanosensitive channel